MAMHTGYGTKVIIGTRPTLTVEFETRERCRGGQGVGVATEPVPARCQRSRRSRAGP